MSVGDVYQRGKAWYFTFGSGAERRESSGYRTQSGAKKAATALRNRLARAEAVAAASCDEIRPWDGTLGWWCELLAHLGRRVASGGTADQRNDLRAIAQAAQSVKSLHDLVELEDRIRRLEQLESESELKETHAIGSDVPAAEAGTEVGPVGEVH